MSFRTSGYMVPATPESSPQSLSSFRAAFSVVARALMAQIRPYPAHSVCRVLHETSSRECHDSMMVATRSGELAGGGAIMAEDLAGQ